MKKTVSQLNHAGFFVGPTDADASPLEPNVFLLPGGAIDVPPPDVPAGKVARWDGGWVFEAAPIPVNIPTPEVVEQPPQLTPVQITKLADFFKNNPDIAEAFGL